MKTGFSLLEILHRENPVFITGNGFAVCVVFPHMKNPVFITEIPANENRFFPVGNTTQGKPCFHYRDGFAVFCNSLLRETP